jgi:hypothetical protein
MGEHKKGGRSGGSGYRGGHTGRGGGHEKGGCLAMVLSVLGILAVTPFAGAAYALLTR